MPFAGMLDPNHSSNRQVLMLKVDSFTITIPTSIPYTTSSTLTIVVLGKARFTCSDWHQRVLEYAEAQLLIRCGKLIMKLRQQGLGAYDAWNYACMNGV